MQKSMQKIGFLLVAVFAAACSHMQTTDYVGQKLDTVHRQPLNPAGGDHRFQTTSFKTSYQYKINAALSELSLDGSIQSVLDPGTHWLGAILNRLSLENVVIALLFAQADGTVVAVEQFRLAPYSSVFARNTFKQTLPIRPEFKWVTIRVRAEMNDYDVHIRSYQISETESKEYGGGLNLND